MEPRFVCQVLDARQVPKQVVSEMADALITFDYTGRCSTGIHRLPSIAAATATKRVVREKETFTLLAGFLPVANWCMNQTLVKPRDGSCSSNCIEFVFWIACLAQTQRMIGLRENIRKPPMVPGGRVEHILGENLITSAAVFGGIRDGSLAEELELFFASGAPLGAERQIHAANEHGDHVTLLSGY